MRRLAVLGSLFIVIASPFARADYRSNINAACSREHNSHELVECVKVLQHEFLTLSKQRPGLVVGGTYFANFLFQNLALTLRSAGGSSCYTDVRRIQDIVRDLERVYKTQLYRPTTCQEVVEFYRDLTTIEPLWVACTPGQPSGKHMAQCLKPLLSERAEQALKELSRLSPTTLTEQILVDSAVKAKERLRQSIAGAAAECKDAERFTSQVPWTYARLTNAGKFTHDRADFLAEQALVNSITCEFMIELAEELHLASE
jgi:hypothetical protein